MDISLLVFFTGIAFVSLIFGYLFKRTGLGSAFNVLAMAIFLLISFVFFNQEAITTSMMNATVIEKVPLDSGISWDNLGLIYMLFSLVAFYAEL